MNQQDNPAPTESIPQSSITQSTQLNTLRAIQTVLSVAVIMATLFTIWTPSSLLSNSLTEKMSLALQSRHENVENLPTPTSRPQEPIGIVAGHWGNDSGAVCPDGLKEVDLNLEIATLVRNNLVSLGYTVDLLKEFDPNLYQYQGKLLLSIHNDSCEYINNEATGFKVAAALATSAYPEKSNRLTACLIDRYAKATNMSFHYSSITHDMKEYHAFDEINASTPAAIIETGFMNLDREILTQHPDQIAAGVTSGILCFLNNELISPTSTPATP